MDHNTMMTALKTSMKCKDKIRTQILREVKTKVDAQVKDWQNKGNEGYPACIHDKVLGTIAKMRKDSIKAYSDANRDDLVEVEQAELDIITEYLPKQMTETEIKEAVHSIIVSEGCSTMRDMGVVMKIFKTRYGTQADASVASTIVRQELSG
jgi:uncharacterized protein YqeY